MVGNKILQGQSKSGIMQERSSGKIQKTQPKRVHKNDDQNKAISARASRDAMVIVVYCNNGESEKNTHRRATQPS